MYSSILLSGMPQYNNYGRGNREIGNRFYMSNFTATLYQADPTSNAFSDVMEWSLEDGIAEIAQPVYNSANNRMVRDSPPIRIQELHFIQKQNILWAVGCFAIALTTVFLLWIVLCRTNKIVRAMQPVMSCVVLIGGYIVAGRVFVASVHITDSTCIAGLWLGHFGFAAVFAPLFVKMWRVQAILNSGFKKVRISDGKVLKLVAVVLAFAAVYLCILTWAGKPHAGTKCVVISNQEICDLECSFDYPEYHTTLFAIEAASIFYGAYLCYQIKGAPEAVNESSEISKGMDLCIYFQFVLNNLFSYSIFTRYKRRTFPSGVLDGSRS